MARFNQHQAEWPAQYFLHLPQRLLTQAGAPLSGAKCIWIFPGRRLFSGRPVNVLAVRLGLVLALPILTPETLALDPSTAITQYHQDVRNERDGLPQGSVQAITQ